MKASKLSTTLFTISVVAMTILVFDITSYLRGRKGYVIGKTRSTLVEAGERDADVIKRLNDVMSNINSLSTKVGAIDSKLLMIEKALEKNTQMSNTLTNSSARSAETNIPASIRGHRSNDFSTSNSIGGVFSPEPILSDPYMRPSYWQTSGGWGIGTGSTHGIRRMNERYISNEPKLHEFEKKRYLRNYNHDNGYLTRARSGIYRRRRRDLESITRNEHPYRQNQSIRGTISFKRSNPELVNQKELVQSAPTDFRSLSNDFTPLEVNKTSIPGTFNLDDVFATIGKDNDPLVEVKRFGDLESFKKFAKNQAEHKDAEEENDGAIETSYYRMSDILGSVKPPKKEEMMTPKDIFDLTRSWSDAGPTGAKSDSPTTSSRDNKSIFEHTHHSNDNKTSLFDNLKNIKDETRQSIPVESNTGIAAKSVKSMRYGNDIGKDSGVGKQVSDESRPQYERDTFNEKPDLETTSGTVKIVIRGMGTSNEVSGTDSAKAPLLHCESFGNPREAFKSGKCTYKTPIIKTEETLLGGEFPLSAEEFIKSINNTIKEMEKTIKSTEETNSNPILKDENHVAQVPSITDNSHLPSSEAHTSQNSKATTPSVGRSHEKSTTYESAGDEAQSAQTPLRVDTEDVQSPSRIHPLVQ